MLKKDTRGLILQNVSFAPPEGYKEAEQQGRTRSNPDEPSLSRTGGSMGEAALQEVAANLDSVKVAIKTGAADRGQIIDMLTNLLRETLQVLYLRLPAYIPAWSFCCTLNGATWPAQCMSYLCP